MDHIAVLPPAPLILPTLVFGGALVVAVYLGRCVAGGGGGPRGAKAALGTRALLCAARIYGGWQSLRAAVAPGGRDDDSRGAVAAAAAAATDREDGCVLVRATIHTGTATRDCHTFEGVRRNAQLGHRVRLVYGLADRPGEEFAVTYNPLRGALRERQAMRCPPHDPAWCDDDDNDCAPPPPRAILTATLTAHRADGKTSHYDVTSELRRALGPLGDFHSRAGGTITARTLAPALEDEVVAATLLYYDEDGGEYTRALPHVPGDDRESDPEPIDDRAPSSSAGAPDATAPTPGHDVPYPGTPRARLLPESLVSPALPDKPASPAVVRALIAARGAREMMRGRRGRAAAPATTKPKQKTCDLQ